MSTGGVGHNHLFDPISGWCAHCNLRQDGRLIGSGGEVYRPGPEYDNQIQALKEMAFA